MLSASSLFLIGALTALTVESAANVREGQIAHSHTFFHPLSTDPARESWYTSGTAIDDSNGLAIFTSGENPEGSGGIWSKVPLTSDDFSLEAFFRLNATGPARASEGFALWYLEEPEFEFLRGKTGDSVSKLWGYSPQFKGFGAFFSISNRIGDVNPSISAGYSDGNKIWNPVSDVPTNAGIYYDFRSNPNSIRLRVTFSPTKGVTGQIRIEPSETWITCFTVPNIIVSPGGFIGFSGSFKTLPGATNAADAPGDSLRLMSFTTTNYDTKMATLIDDAKFLAQDREFLKSFEALNAGNISETPITAEQQLTMLQVLARHIDQASYNQQSLLKRLAAVERNEQIAFRQLQVVEQSLKVLASADVVRSELQGLKDVLDTAHNQQAEVIRQLGSSLADSDSKKEAVARSEQLEKSVRQHTLLSVMLSVSFGVLMTALGFFTLRRMNAMEKKHLL